MRFGNVSVFRETGRGKEMVEVGTKLVHTDPWRADELDRAAERLDWAAKDAHKPIGNFDADYRTLCQ